MAQLENKDEFMVFCENAINEGLKDNMTIELDDFETFKNEALEALDNVMYDAGDNDKGVSTIRLDELNGSTLFDYLDELGFDIIAPNVNNDNYELITWPDTSNPMEQVRRSLVSAGTGDVLDLLRTRLEDETGKDPINESWFVK